MQMSWNVLKWQEPIIPIISASLQQMALAHEFLDQVNYFFLKENKIWFMDKDKYYVGGRPGTVFGFIVFGRPMILMGNKLFI